MNGRERLLRVLDGKPTDRVPWTTIADDGSRHHMPDGYRNVNILDFYRKIGCDILQFGTHGMPSGTEPDYPFEFKTDVIEQIESLPNETLSITRKLNGRTLQVISQKGHPIKYPVESPEELRIYLEMVEASQVSEKDIINDDSFSRCSETIGDSGIFAPTMLPSPVQQLIEYECGIEAFYYLLADHTELMERVIATMFKRKYTECKLLAEKTPFPMIIPVENTSSAMISPSLYRKYSLPHMQAYADVIHRNDKKFIIHMCGHLKDLLPEFKKIGLDGIHALTPPHTGDCSFESALDVLGEDLIIIGILPPELLHHPLATADDIREGVKSVLTARIKESNFILWPGIDGISTDIWRLEAVRDGVEKYGAR